MNCRASRASELLVCPSCNERLAMRHSEYLCFECGSTIPIKDDVVLLDEFTSPSFFDDKFEVMQQGHSPHKAEFALCYQQQLEYVARYLDHSMVVADVGCGPGLTYSRHPECALIGIEPSFVSLRANPYVDLRICGRAARMPLPSGCLDAILCFYSLHHMVGQTVAQTKENVHAALTEFVRVLKPDGHLFVAEMTPGPISARLQRRSWNLARGLLRTRLDQFFWTASQLTTLGIMFLPDANLTCVSPTISAWTLIPPVFSLPWLKIPRWLFPLVPTLFHWQRNPSVPDGGRVRRGSSDQPMRPTRRMVRGSRSGLGAGEPLSEKPS